MHQALVLANPHLADHRDTAIWGGVRKAIRDVFAPEDADCESDPVLECRQDYDIRIVPSATRDPHRASAVDEFEHDLTVFVWIDSALLPDEYSYAPETFGNSIAVFFREWGWPLGLSISVQVAFGSHGSKVVTVSELATC